MSSVLIVVFLVLVLSWKYCRSNGERFRHLLKGRALIEELSRKHGTRPFSLPVFGFGGRVHTVSSEMHMLELSKASQEHLSVHAWGGEQMQSHYSLGVKWATVDHRHKDGNFSASAIRTSWKSHARWQETFMRTVREELSNAFERGTQKSGGFREIHLGNLIELVNARLNTMWTLGEDLANNHQFMEKGLAYSREAKIIAELAKLMPSSIIATISPIFKRISGNEKHVCLSMLQKLEEKRRNPVQETTADTPTFPTIIDALVHRTPSHWSMSDLLRETNVTWNTTNFVTPVLITGVIQDLSLHSNYHTALKQEASEWTITQSQDRLRLLDAFITESMRTQCFSSTRIHRVALHNFTFSDGYTVTAGQTVGFNIQRLFNDQAVYPSPTKFAPERHVESKISATDVSLKWPFWGSQRLPCPGRFYAIHVTKLLAVCLLQDWEFELKKGQSPSILYREFSIPHPGLKILLKPLVSN